MYVLGFDLINMRISRSVLLSIFFRKSWELYKFISVLFSLYSSIKECIEKNFKNEEFWDSAENRKKIFGIYGIFGGKCARCSDNFRMNQRCQMFLLIGHLFFSWKIFDFYFHISISWQVLCIRLRNNKEGLNWKHGTELGRDWNRFA